MFSRPHYRPQCALCGCRDAQTPDDIDNVLVLVCFSCKEPPRIHSRGRPKQIARREYVLRALGRLDGPQPLADIAEAIGEDSVEGRAQLSQVLARAVKDGIVVAIGEGTQNRTYEIVRGKMQR